jgi:type III secretory pathway component EscT
MGLSLLSSTIDSLLPAVVRAAGMWAVIPVPGGATRRMGIAIVFALTSTGVSTPSETIYHPNVWVPLELFIGAALGFPCAALTSCARELGALLDTGRGQNLGTTVNSFINGSSHATGVLFEHLVLMDLWRLGVGTILLQYYLASLGTLPLRSSELTPSAITVILSSCAGMLAALVSLAVPALVLLLAVDLSQIVVAKTVPGVNVTHELFMVKTLLLLLLIGLANGWYDAALFLQVLEEGFIGQRTP